MERGSFDVEISFAQWLGKTHPNPNYNTLTYRTGSPYQQRTAVIPGRLVIPPQEYAVTCITNRANFNVNYSFRWGTREWQKYTLAPGQNVSHWLGYEGGSRHSDDLAVIFDETLNDNQNINKSYVLLRNASQSQQCPGGKQYHFLLRTDNGKLDIFASQ